MRQFTAEWGFIVMIPFAIEPTPTPGTFTEGQVTDVIDAIDRTAGTFQEFTFGVAVLFVLALFALALIAYFYFNRNASRGAQQMLETFSAAMGKAVNERDERIDKLETEQATRDEKYIESLSAIGDGLHRIADITDLIRKNETGRDRILSDATSAMTAIVTTGSKPLQQVVKDVSGIQDTTKEIKQIVSQIYDRLLVIFPTQQPMIEQVRDMLIDTVKEVSEEKKHDTGEAEVISLDPPADLPKAVGE